MEDAQEKEHLVWTSFPAAESKMKAVIVSVFLVVLFTFIHLTFGAGWFLIALLLLGGSVAPYFAITRYTMTDEEIVIQHLFFTARKSWSAFRSYYVDRRGVLLSPFSRPSRLENYRGLYLRFGPNRDEVLQFVRRRLGDRQDKREAAE
jgi:hypothetical protein